MRRGSNNRETPKGVPPSKNNRQLVTCRPFRDSCMRTKPNSYRHGSYRLGRVYRQGSKTLFHAYGPRAVNVTICCRTSSNAARLWFAFSSSSPSMASSVKATLLLILGCPTKSIAVGSSKINTRRYRPNILAIPAATLSRLFSKMELDFKELYHRIRTARSENTLNGIRPRVLNMDNVNDDNKIR